MDSITIRRIARLIYYFAKARGRAKTTIGIDKVASVALLTPQEAHASIHKIASIMGKGCRARVLPDKTLVLHFVEGKGSEVSQVFDYWKVKHEKKKIKLTNDRRSKITARLNEGYTVTELKRAIDGILYSAFHVQNCCTDITNVCSKGSNVDRFMTFESRYKNKATGNGIMDHMRRIGS